ncbi:MAG: AMP-binding protein [Oscillospiraceae bacterium]|nr:AMP-binding protein [Oscillospiraceae bacterium]
MAIARSRFYRKHFSSFSHIRTIADFENLPFTTPEHITQDAGSFLCVSPDEVSRIVTLATSGTTGKNKRLFFTESDQELTIDFFHHGMSTFTAPGDNVMIFMPGQAPGGVCDLLARALHRLGAEGRIFGGISDYESAALALKKFCPDVVVGMPKQVHQLATAMGFGFSCKSVLLASDFISDDCVSSVSAAWDCEVFTHYGLTESGLGGAVSCRAHSGYHMREADLYFEIIDPVTEKTLPDGEYGEIVFTTLSTKAMPLIRYRTGDHSRILSKRCPCGSIIRRFESISDRGIIKCWS